ncbi:hypothetical protein [Mycolicibacterium komossense]|uniref:Uncharacterized protein n=1 Tax=Mycolicibacterium komossense TaxID=1779 RepID=A0ABT3C7X9_9MYCO|nr:hypothetical protein [Mycolicibacterium komossense]MCV7225331.1 hypothetical protein [Mycolicibacterium komossense]
MHSRRPWASAWLGLTPEPESVLPQLLARLRREPTDSAFEDEQRRASHVVLRGTCRQWLRYLDRAAAVVRGIADGTRDGDPTLALAVAHVVLEHDRMLIGLPGGAYRLTAERRRRTAEAIGVLEARIASVKTDNELEMS